MEFFYEIYSRSFRIIVGGIADLSVKMTAAEGM
jgi:hypothetical protein